MTIKLELDPEVEARLVAFAEERGVTPETYAGDLLQEALVPVEGPSGRLTVEEVREMLRELSVGSERLPNLPTSSFTRESFYEDRW